LVGAGLLGEDRANRELLAATSLPEREAVATIKSGLGWGRDHPREVTAVGEQGHQHSAGRTPEQAPDWNKVPFGRWPRELLEAGGLDLLNGQGVGRQRARRQTPEMDL
jgi:hypothetical protein